jgi:hypothetical protein
LPQPGAAALKGQVALPAVTGSKQPGPQVSEQRQRVQPVERAVAVVVEEEPVLEVLPVC